MLLGCDVLANARDHIRRPQTIEECRAIFLDLDAQTSKTKHSVFEDEVLQRYGGALEELN